MKDVITNKSNSKIKNIVALIKNVKKRRALGLFILEGKKTLNEIDKNIIDHIIVSESFVRGNKDDMNYIKNFAFYIVSDDVYRVISDTVTPQGISIICKCINYDKNDLNKASLVLLLENINDPGNMGTIFRSAAASGIDCIILDKNCVDPYNLKCIRASLGAVIRVKHYICDSLYDEIQNLHKLNFNTYAAHLKAREIYYDCDFSKKTAFIIGNESKGISDEISNLAKNKIIIPMSSKMESLNAAVAASILMFEVSRQKGVRYNNDEE